MSNEENLTAFFDRLETIVVSKYRHYAQSCAKRVTCNKLQGRTLDVTGKPVCRINFSALHDACAQMKTDIRFLMERRGNLVEKLRLSMGKVAGVMTYRLARNHIVHLCEGCASCDEQMQCNASKLNHIFALQCAWDYIGINYLRVQVDIRKELLYSLSYRHVNQETLGLVFDTIHATQTKT